MNDIARQSIVDGSTRLYGIVGHPIEQVKSPLAFNPRFAAAGLNAILVPLDVPPEHFEKTVRGLMGLANLGGLIVTVPYKAQAMKLVDDILPTGHRVGAINAMRPNTDGTWTGDMFDGRGLMRSLTEEGISVAGKRVLLLGAGGAGSAVAVAFAEAGAAAICVHDTHGAKAADLVARVKGAFHACDIRAGAPLAKDHDVVVNATPVGMAQGDGLPAEIGALNRGQLVIDVIMKPEVTPLLALARESGCRAVGGKAMLAGQMDEVAKFFGIGEKR